MFVPSVLACLVAYNPKANSDILRNVKTTQERKGSDWDLKKVISYYYY